METKSLIFDKSSGNWKHILTKADVENWVEKTSQSKASLKVVEGNGEKTEFSEDESIAIFKAVYDNKSVFTSISGVSGDGKKTILFEKIDNGWKHSKTEIKNWLTKVKENDSKFEIKINDDTTALDSADEGGLIGLLKHLTDNQTNLTSTYKNMTLTLKKNDNWIVSGAKTTN